jgi:hypothetical protein
VFPITPLVDAAEVVGPLDAEPVFVEQFIQQVNHPETGWGRLWREFHREPATTDERRQS